jgi:hypothetical protein
MIVPLKGATPEKKFRATPRTKRSGEPQRAVAIALNRPEKGGAKILN